MRRHAAVLACALASAAGGAGCYDRHAGDARGGTREPPQIRLEPSDVLDRLPPLPPSVTPTAGAPAAPVPDAGSELPVQSPEDQALGCLTGPAAVFEGDFYASAWNRRELAELDGVREVTGLLVVQESDSVHLDELRCLRKAGSLHLLLNEQLETLRGLARLADVPGYIYITRNLRLRDLSGLAAVTQPLGREPHDRCPDVAGCASGALAIESNPALESLAGLQHIAEIQGGVSILHNASLVELTGLEGLTYVNGNVRVRQNSLLQDMAALAALTRVEGDVEIMLNPSLRLLGSGFALREIGGTFLLAENGELASIAALSSLASVGRLVITNSPGLRDLSGLTALTRIEHGLEIATNTALESIAALGSVRGQLGQDPEAEWPFPRTRQVTAAIDDNPALRSLVGLQGIERIGGDFVVSNNRALVDLRGLDGLVAVHSNLELFANESLVTLDGLDNLRRVGRNFVVSDHARLVSAEALSKLEYVGALLDLQDNAALEDVELPALTFARSSLLP